MKDLDLAKTIQILDTIIEFELAGVVRYTHYSLMVTGPHRIPIVQFFQAQAQESLLHAQQVGEILTGLEGHPSLRVAPIEESFRHSVHDILKESLVHETKALSLEEFARTMIGQEELHGLELKKMLRDYTPV
jgi:bacterioferritin